MGPGPLVDSPKLGHTPVRPLNPVGTQRKVGLVQPDWSRGGHQMGSSRDPRVCGWAMSLAPHSHLKVVRKVQNEKH